MIHCFLTEYRFGLETYLWSYITVIMLKIILIKKNFLDICMNAKIPSELENLNLIPLVKAIGYSMNMTNSVPVHVLLSLHVDER